MAFADEEQLQLYCSRSTEILLQRRSLLLVDHTGLDSKPTAKYSEYCTQDRAPPPKFRKSSATEAAEWSEDCQPRLHQFGTKYYIATARPF